MADTREKQDETFTHTNETYTAYGGQRGGGRIFFLENLVAFLKTQLEEVKQDRDRWQSAALYYAERTAKQKWIPVTERLPEEYEPVLVFDPSVDHGQYVMRACCSIDGWMTEFDFDHCENYGITHWMPMPEPPKGEPE